MKQLKMIFAFISVLSLGLIIVGCGEVQAAEEAYVTIDINPSVELIVTPTEKVVYANPLNEDGELLLTNLNLIGLYLDEALELIIDEATNLGFIDVEDETSVVYINALCNDPELGEKIQTRAKEHVNNAFQDRAMMGRAEDKGFTPEEILEAESYGVTPGFLRLAKTVVEYDDTITLEEALAMEQEALLDILKEARSQNREMAFALREAFHTERQAIFDVYHPQIVALRTEIEDLEEALELGEGDLEAIQAEIDQKQEELDALVLEFREAMEALRETYQDDLDQVKEQMMIMHQVRTQENRDKVEAFRNEIQNRRDLMEEMIKEYQQGGAPDNNSSRP